MQIGHYRWGTDYLTLLMEPCEHLFSNNSQVIHMALSVWEVFLDLFRGGEKSNEESGNERGEEEDEDRFVPSSLDLSV